MLTIDVQVCPRHCELESYITPSLLHRRIPDQDTPAFLAWRSGAFSIPSFCYLPSLAMFPFVNTVPPSREPSESLSGRAVQFGHTHAYEVTLLARSCEFARR